MNSVPEWLSTAAGWRWGSLLFQSPTAAGQDDLQALAAELPSELRDRAKEMLAISLDEWEAEFHSVLGPAGIPACESSYDDNVLAGRGPLLAEIAGFYEAFAYRPESAQPETPDHLTVEMDFLSYLALKVAYALHEETPREKEIAEAAYRRFLETHPLFWLPRFCERTAESGSPFYSEAAAWLADWTRQRSGVASKQL